MSHCSSCTTCDIPSRFSACKREHRCGEHWLLDGLPDQAGTAMETTAATMQAVPLMSSLAEGLPC